MIGGIAEHEGGKTEVAKAIFFSKFLIFISI